MEIKLPHIYGKEYLVMQPTIDKEKDKQLRDAVLRQLEWEPEIQSNDVNIGAKDGVVTLSGFVHSYTEKSVAERAAKRVYGALAIANDIEVKPATMRTDPEIARDIIEAMKIDTSVPDHGIKVAIRDGFVTLEGTTDWNFQREAAERCARKVGGVRGITNYIEVKPKVSTTQVKAKIEEALKRSAEVDARRIVVSAADTTVTLYGNVHSWFEREEAKRAAWAAPGVSRVIDHMVIVP